MEEQDEQKEQKEQSQQNNKWVVEGFVFYTKKDACLARQEQKKAEYLEAHMHYGNPEKVLGIYKRAIEERVFRTPVGINYLKNMQQFLRENGEIREEDIPPIPLFLQYDGELRGHASPARRRIQPSQKQDNKRNGLILSIILNVVMFLAIIAMFIISLRADHPNILNYERMLQDRYAGWEQELTERERVVREKERVLQMEENSHF